MAHLLTKAVIAFEILVPDDVGSAQASFAVEDEAPQKKSPAHERSVAVTSHGLPVEDHTNMQAWVTFADGPNRSIVVRLGIKIRWDCPAGSDPTDCAMRPTACADLGDGYAWDAEGKFCEKSSSAPLILYLSIAGSLLFAAILCVCAVCVMKLNALGSFRKVHAGNFSCEAGDGSIIPVDDDDDDDGTPISKVMGFLNRVSKMRSMTKKEAANVAKQAFELCGILRSSDNVYQPDFSAQIGPLRKNSASLDIKRHILGMVSDESEISRRSQNRGPLSGLSRHRLTPLFTSSSSYDLQEVSPFDEVRDCLCCLLCALMPLPCGPVSTLLHSLFHPMQALKMYVSVDPNLVASIGKDLFLDIFEVNNQSDEEPLLLVALQVNPRHGTGMRRTLSICVVCDWLLFPSDAWQPSRTQSIIHLNLQQWIPDKLAFVKFVRAIESHYHTAPQYHNAIHAADVTARLAAIISNSGITNGGDSDQSRLILFAAILSAIVHDVDHPGMQSAVQRSQEWNRIVEQFDPVSCALPQG